MSTIKKKILFALQKKGDPSDSDVIYLGKFLDWEEASDYFKNGKLKN